MFTNPLPEQVVASAFVNRESYLVLANYGQLAVELELSSGYVSTDDSAAGPHKQWDLPPRSLQILRRSV